MVHQNYAFLQNKLLIVACLHDFFFSVTCDFFGFDKTLSLHVLYFSASWTASFGQEGSTLLSITWKRISLSFSTNNQIKKFNTYTASFSPVLPLLDLCSLYVIKTNQTNDNREKQLLHYWLYCLMSLEEYNRKNTKPLYSTCFPPYEATDITSQFPNRMETCELLSYSPFFSSKHQHHKWQTTRYSSAIRITSSLYRFPPNFSITESKEGVILIDNRVPTLITKFMYLCLFSIILRLKISS